VERFDCLSFIGIEGLKDQSSLDTYRGAFYDTPLPVSRGLETSRCVHEASTGGSGLIPKFIRNPFLKKVERVHHFRKITADDAQDNVVHAGVPIVN